MLQCALVLCLLASDTGNVVYYGPVPKEYIRTNKSQRVEPVRLARDGPDFLIIENDASLAVFAVADTGLKRMGIVPLPVLPSEWEVARRWLERDMDGDSLPEFVVANGSELWEFKWQDAAFALTSVATLPDSSAWIEDFVLGDVDRDGLDEVILVAGNHRPDSAHDVSTAGTLFVCRWSTDTLRELWTDGGRFELECASFTMVPDGLLGVYDVRNVGRPELLYRVAESSIGPFTHVCYEWSDSALLRSRSFILDGDCTFAENVPDSERFSFVMGMSPLVENGKTKLLTSSVDGRFYTGERIIWDQVIELHGDTIVNARTVYATGDEHEEAHCEMDPDGRGKGVLRLVSSGVGGLWYEFRR